MKKEEIASRLLADYGIDVSSGEHSILVWAKLPEDADEDGFELDICFIDGELCIDPEIESSCPYTVDEITIVEII